MSIDRFGLWGRTGVAGSVALFLFVFVVGLALAASLPPGGTFTDDDGNVHEANIEAIAAEGITQGCNPPVNNLYCPDRSVSRAQMATFLTRALGLPAAVGSFIDTAGSVHEANIGALAAAGITVGCNPPTNDMFCPDKAVTRAQMATFLTRALNLTPIAPPPPTSSTTTTTTTTTAPGDDHPQSGVGWEYLGCSNPVGTCSYPQSAVESQLKYDQSLLPPKYCLPDPFEPWRCLIEGEQWQHSWYDSGGSKVAGSCSFSYVGSYLVSVTCKMPIDGAATGEYRSELCRSEWPSTACVETLLTTYFNVAD
jgi:hypothetical protein